MSYPSSISVAGGNWGQTSYLLQSSSTANQKIYWLSGDSAGSTAIYYNVSEQKWYDGSNAGQPSAFDVNSSGTPTNPSVVVAPGDSVKLTDGTSGNRGTFTMFTPPTSGGGGSTAVELVLVKSIILTLDQLPPGSTALHSVAPFAYRWSWLKGPDFSYINVTIKDPVNATYDVVWLDGANTVRGTITESGVDTNGDAYLTSRVPIELPSSNTDFSVEEDDGTVIDIIDGSVNFRTKVSLNFW